MHGESASFHVLHCSNSIRQVANSAPFFKSLIRRGCSVSIVIATEFSKDFQKPEWAQSVHFMGPNSFEGIQVFVPPNEATTTELRLQAIIQKLRPSFVQTWDHDLFYTISKSCKREHVTAIGVWRGLGARFDFLRTGQANLLNEAYISEIASNEHFTSITEHSDDAELLMRHFPSMRKRTHVLGKSISLNPETTVQYTPPPSILGPLHFVLIGRMLWSKGVADFVNAAYQIRKEHNAVFSLVGPEKPGIIHHIPLRQLQYWDDSKVVQWQREHKNMISTYQNAHVIVLPTWFPEGIPRVLVEAALNGRPCIATPQLGCREVVKHGVNGLLVPAENLEALVQAMEYFIKNPDKILSMGNAGLTIGKKFSLESIVDSLLSAYTSIKLPAGSH